VFKNPAGDYAGRLIESVGLKGKRIGGAMISPKHANFIVNTGEARGDDILALMDLARKRVKEKTGIWLEPEIRVVD
jgi:UDP-N-acetylmuramate dehydrogenase